MRSVPLLRSAARQPGPPSGVEYSPQDMLTSHPPSSDPGGATDLRGPTAQEASESPPALQALDVTNRYGSNTVLDHVSLAVGKGECLALVGESGAGKSTLLRCFNRMVTPSSGEVRVRGRDVQELDPVELRRHMGYVQQEGGLLPHWTALRNAALVPWLLGQEDIEARAAAALARVGLDPERFGGRWPGELSGGERQRVAMARALAAGPDVVLLDEPFGALDAITRGELQDGFTALRRDLGITAVLVTHDLREAVILADRIAVLRGGCLDQVGTARELSESPATRYVARLLSRAGAGS